ncbi:MAG: hypothetical protein ACR2QK_21405 [Acidimicrobiales bacterium]
MVAIAMVLRAAACGSGDTIGSRPALVAGTGGAETVPAELADGAQQTVADQPSARPTVSMTATTGPLSSAMTTTAPATIAPSTTAAATTSVGESAVAQPTSTVGPVAPVPPTASPIPMEQAAGVPSAPQFTDRAGTGAGLGFDLPVPAQWDAVVGADFVSVSVTGRGDLTARFYPLDDLAWRSEVNPGADQQITAGPAALAVPIHRSEGPAVVTTGQVVGGHEYRFATTTSFLRKIVRWYELDGLIVVAVLSYPDPDRVPEALTGLTPEQILDDVRLLERQS